MGIMSCFQLVCTPVMFASRGFTCMGILPVCGVLQALQKMAEENEGRITCQRTHEVFSIEDARKVFVM